MYNIQLRLLTYNLCRIYRPNGIRNLRKFATKTFRKPPPDETDENDVPIKYSTSKAATYKAAVSRHGPFRNRLQYEPEVIMASIAILLIYFTMIREENDIDEELGKSLYSRIEGLEELQLKLSLKYNKENNKSTKDIENRLQEIELEKQSKAMMKANIEVE